MNCNSFGIFLSVIARNFAIQLDETTEVSSNSQLMMRVRYEGVDNFEEELMFNSPVEFRSHGIEYI